MSELETLNLFNTALQNAVDNTQIYQSISELGYDEEKINEGKALCETTKATFEKSAEEKHEESSAYYEFSEKKKELFGKYRLHRKKAKVVFKKQPVVLNLLMVNTRFASGYHRRINQVSTFYNAIKKDEKLQSEVAKLKLTLDEISSCLAMVSEVEASRMVYVKEKGDSQNATEVKNKTLDKLEDWMSEFYDVAEIALEEHPQLLESLGKVVK